MIITLDYLHTRNVCWSDEEITALLPPDGCTPLELCDCTSVPVEGRLYVLLHTSILPERTLRWLCCRWAAAQLRTRGVDDLRAWRAIWTSLQYAEGLATAEQLSAAESAAWSAAESAALSAAESAAWSAAESAALSAARSAAWSAQLADVRRELVREARAA